MQGKVGCVARLWIPRASGFETGIKGCRRYPAEPDRDQQAVRGRDSANQEDISIPRPVGYEAVREVRDADIGTPAEIEAYAAAMADMLCAYLVALRQD
jgi:hypothetical protein